MKTDLWEIDAAWLAIPSEAEDALKRSVRAAREPVARLRGTYVAFMSQVQRSSRIPTAPISYLDAEARSRVADWKESLLVWCGHEGSFSKPIFSTAVHLTALGDRSRGQDRRSNPAVSPGRKLVPSGFKIVTESLRGCWHWISVGPHDILKAIVEGCLSERP